MMVHVRQAALTAGSCQSDLFWHRRVERWDLCFLCANRASDNQDGEDGEQPQSGCSSNPGRNELNTDLPHGPDSMSGFGSKGVTKVTVSAFVETSPLRSNPLNASHR